MYGDLAPKSTREKFIEATKYILAILGLMIGAPLLIVGMQWAIEFGCRLMKVLGPYG